jgi:aminomethyltransferase
MSSEVLHHTFFTKFHKAAGAKFVPFAGYEMPVSFIGGIQEHDFVRNQSVGLFDVSHMGQLTIVGDNAITEFEALVPSDIQSLKLNCAKYTVLMNENGGIIDDCIVTRASECRLFIVFNGSRKHIVYEHLVASLPTANVIQHNDFGLLALQGKEAVNILRIYVPDIDSLKFMHSDFFQLAGIRIRISRCGYTGEDGFELSVPEHSALQIYMLLMQHADVHAIGLGARDTLRLEAGLCLYGQDIDMTTTPIEAGLSWVICKKRTKNHAYIGSKILQNQFDTGAIRHRVGLLPQTKAPVRQGVELFNAHNDKIGMVTSGTFSPTLKTPIAMGYLQSEYTPIGTQIFAELRGKKIPVIVAKLPFVKHGYVK